MWYGAEVLRTALAEKSYWRLRFLLDSPGTPDLKPVPHTAFRATVRTATALDLRTEPLARERELWTSRSDYAHTQALATVARAAGIELMRYESVRDPQHGSCAAVLTPAAFGRGKPRCRRPGSSPPPASGCAVPRMSAAGRPGSSPARSSSEPQPRSSPRGPRGLSVPGGFAP